MPSLGAARATAGRGRALRSPRAGRAPAWLEPQRPCPERAGLTAAAPLTQEPLFAARVIYDLLFFFMVIIIVLNLIFGVIIDTFADLRSEKQKKEEILKTTCFICGECGTGRG